MKFKKKRLCVNCNTEFLLVNGRQKYCGKDCQYAVTKRISRYNMALKYKDNPEKYRKQKRENGLKLNYSSWGNYFKYLIKAGRAKEARKYLVVSDLISLAEKQKYKCALSGIELNHIHKSPYIASIDRIDPKGSYVVGNIQLVCRCVNTFRSDFLIPDFVALCKAVAENNK